MRDMKSIIVFSAFAFLITGCAKKSVDEHASITFMMGEVTKNGSTVRIGQPLAEQDVIETGVNSFCDVRIGESLVRIKQSTRMEIATLRKSSGAENTSIEMITGKMLCKPKKLLKDDSFIVRTPTAIAGVRGTQFTVEADQKGTSRIKVFDGKVKVAMRLKGLDEYAPRLLEIAPELEKEEKVVVTARDVEKAQKVVDAIMAKERGKDAAVEALFSKASREIVIPRNNIETFSPDEFEKDAQEMIAVREKTTEVKKRISEIIEEDIEAPQSEGRLLVTRYEIFFIRGGKIEWEGKIAQPPLRQGDRLYVASGDYVFCASLDGPVMWKRELPNSGKLRMDADKLYVELERGEAVLDPKTGRRL